MPAVAAQKRTRLLVGLVLVLLLAVMIGLRARSNLSPSASAPPEVSLVERGSAPAAVAERLPPRNVPALTLPPVVSAASTPSAKTAATTRGASSKSDHKTTTAPSAATSAREPEAAPSGFTPIPKGKLLPL